MHSNDQATAVFYSGPYLAGPHPVTVAPDVGVNVQVVRPGETARWAAEAAQLRTCVLLRGKVRVRIGAAVQSLGPEGAFVVRPGQTCVVENRVYEDAAIVCTTVRAYELVELDDGAAG